MAKSRRSVKRHKLLVYHRLGQRMRTIPFLIVLFSLVLLAIAWLGERNLFTDGNQVLLDSLWTNRLALYVMIGAGVLLYLISLYISHFSFIEPRAKTLRIKAGFVPVDLSYARINQIRLVNFKMQHPPDKLKGQDAALVEPFIDGTCTALDIKSLPKPFTRRLIRMMWNKFMFTGDGGSLMFIVPDPMVLNQQIDGYISERQARIKKSTKYLDPIERAAQEQAARAAKATKAEKAKAKQKQRGLQINIGRKR